MANPMPNRAADERSPRAAFVDAPIPGELGPLPFFPVSVYKFVVMSVVSLGLYPLYWAYQQWRRIRDRKHESLSPFWRAAFAPLWGFSLFPRIREELLSQRQPVDWSAGLLATSYLVLSMTWRAPDPWWLISMLSFLPMIPIVRSVAAANRGVPSHEGTNGDFSTENVIGGVVGSLILVLAIIGTFVPAA